MKSIRKRLSYANVMSSIAVFIVLGGGAIAASQLPKKSVGTKQLKANAVTTAKIKKNAVSNKKIKKNAVTGAKVKNDSLTGDDINESTLGTVPSANSAGVASNLAGFSGLKSTKVGASAIGANFEAAANAASSVTLYEDNHFRIYGKCFVDSEAPAELYGITYIATKQDGAIYEGDEDELNGDPSFLNVGTIETDREIQETNAQENDSDMAYEGDSEFGATAADGYTISGISQVAVKFGSLATGDGAYGPGNICLFSGYVFNS